MTEQRDKPAWVIALTDGHLISIRVSGPPAIVERSLAKPDAQRSPLGLPLRLLTYIASTPDAAAEEAWTWREALKQYKHPSGWLIDGPAVREFLSNRHAYNVLDQSQQTTSGARAAMLASQTCMPQSETSPKP
jgi:hypothetical protein